MNAARAALVTLLAAALGAACIDSYPQRMPGPLFPPPSSEPADDAVAEPTTPPSEGAAFTVQRDSDPVWVSLPGERGARLLAFHRKRERVPAGTRVRTGAGGRAEILWSPDASSLALFDECRVTVGDPARDEPLVTFHDVTRALLVLTPEDRIELVGGARLAGDPLETTGPVLLESAANALLRITNESKRLVTVACRDEHLELAPGESLDMPLLADGNEPGGDEPEPQRFEAAGLAVAFQGALERSDEDAGVTLTAREPATVRALGVEVRLEPGGAVRFSGLTQVRGARPADATPRSP